MWEIIRFTNPNGKLQIERKNTLFLLVFNHQHDMKEEQEQHVVNMLYQE